VSLATSYSKEESNRVTFRNNRNANKGRSEGKLVKPATACRKVNYSREITNIRDGSTACRDNMNIMDVNSAEPPE
jgi:hypothetical protein